MLTNCHSYYSLRYGTIKPQDLLKLGVEAGYECMALTDINNTSAGLEFVRLSKKYNIKPVLGVDFRASATQKYVALAKNNLGFQEICEHLSNGGVRANLRRGLRGGSPSGPAERSRSIGESSLPKALACARAATTQADHAPKFKNSFVIYPFSSFKGTRLRKNEFIGVHTDDITRLRFSKWKNKQEKLVMMHTSSFRNKKEFNAHRLLRAIDNNTLLSKLPKSEEGRPTDILLTKKELLKAFEDFPQIIQNTEDLLTQCSIDFEFGTEAPHKNLRCFTGSEEEDFELVKTLCAEGLTYRYPNADEAIHARIDKELEIIRDKEFLSYFLINWDMCEYARSKGYFHVGRGSGANSIVAYLLRITDVDPIELDLYFERFINLYRKNPPDFDIDFSWTDRDDVTRYLFEKYDNIALIATYSTFQYRAVVRELGKVFGLPKHEIDILSKGHFQMHKLDHLSKLVLKYSTLIQEFPNHLSVHAGGILIAQKPIEYYTATFMPPKGYPTTHFDMVSAEDVGLYKFDILSQRGLGKIKEGLEIIKYNRPDEPEIDIHDINRFKEDETIKDMLRNAKAIGCFYVESPAMRMLLRKLQVDDYLGLVAASSVIRPGVARSGMMREYILRFRFPEKRKEAHPILLDIMPDTYGVMVYQEDVIKVAHYFAGLDLGEADVLRRGMSGKFRSRDEFARAKQAFFDKAQDKGHSFELIAEVWRQTESFAGYAFAKGHSASYAVESYQSLFLKAHYPLEYMVATINNFGGFYRTEFYVHEARLHGATIEAPCVNLSAGDTVIYGKIIYLGFGLVKDLERGTIRKLLQERFENGPFTSLLDFVKRVNASLEQVSILIRMGSFRFTEKDKKALLWDAHFLLGNTKKKQEKPKMLFEPEVKKFELPSLYTDDHEDAFDEMQLLGFPLKDPFILLTEDKKDETYSRELPDKVGQVVTIVGYLVTVKNTSTHNGKSMYFGTFVDRRGEWLDTVHFPPIAAEYPFRGRGLYSITGTVTEEFNCINVECISMRKMPIIEDPRYAESDTVTRIRKQEENQGRAKKWEEKV